MNNVENWKLDNAPHDMWLKQTVIYGSQTDCSSCKEWENWKDDDVAQLIHQYWIQSLYEVNHRRVIGQLVKELYAPHETFLEAGCGSGLIYQQLVPNVMKNQCYIGIDITQNMLDIAHKDYPDGRFLWDDLYHLSFADKSVEIVAAFEVLGHLPDIETPIREMCRVASRLVLFTVWINNATVVSEERFRNSRFIHTAYSHADILKTIENVLEEDYRVEAIPLNKDTVAYVIHKLYGARLGLVNLGSAKQSQMEAQRPNEEDHSRIGKADEEDPFGKVAASPNSPNLSGRRIPQESVSAGVVSH